MSKDIRLGSGDFKVTTEQISQWIGDGFNVGFFTNKEEALLEIIADVANGKYDIEELNSDIRGYGCYTSSRMEKK